MPRSMIAASSSGSMLPPAQHQPDLAAAEALRVLEQRRQPRRAGAFDQGLLDLQQHHDSLLDIAFVDQDQVVDVPLDDLPG